MISRVWLPFIYSSPSFIRPLFIFLNFIVFAFSRFLFSAPFRRLKRLANLISTLPQQCTVESCKVSHPLLSKLTIGIVHQSARATLSHLRKLALVGIIPNQILFSFSADKDRRRGLRCVFRLIRLSVLLSLSELKEKRICFHTLLAAVSCRGSCVHYVVVSKFQWKPFWLATQLYPQNDWTGWQIRVNYDVFAQSPLGFRLLSQSSMSKVPIYSLSLKKRKREKKDTVFHSQF